jgi:multisubunit Na+/H+ antiporter MnhB subunit
MKEIIKAICISLIGDIIFGLVASIFVYYLLGELIPVIFTTQLETMSGALKLSILFDKNLMKNIFSIWHNFCFLFGIRFVIAYITGSFCLTKKS